jgi:hypothetical protein
MPFFKEYTKHDEEHINAVLAISDALVPDETLDKLSQKTVAALVASIIIHDIGMFIQPDGVRQLLFYKYKLHKMEHLDSLSWREAWDDFIQKYKRYPSRKLRSIFGDLSDVTPTKTDDIDTGENMWRVYGEFLRMYHPRLAHMICVEQFPGFENINIFTNCVITEDEKDLIGLVARSHGMNMRDTQEYINSESTPISVGIGMTVKVNANKVIKQGSAGEQPDAVTPYTLNR